MPAPFGPTIPQCSPSPAVQSIPSRIDLADAVRAAPEADLLEPDGLAHRRRLYWTNPGYTRIPCAVALPSCCRRGSRRRRRALVPGAGARLSPAEQAWISPLIKVWNVQNSSLKVVIAQALKPNALVAGTKPDNLNLRTRSSRSRTASSRRTGSSSPVRPRRRASNAFRDALNSACIHDQNGANDFAKAIGAVTKEQAAAGHPVPEAGDDRVQEGDAAARARPTTRCRPSAAARPPASKPDPPSLGWADARATRSRSLAARARPRRVRGARSSRPGPAHIATLKTFDPPLAALDGERFAGARRRAKRLLFPTDDGELVLMVHLMSAGRIRYVAPGEKSPKTPEFRLRFADGGELVLTEGGRKKRAGVWLMRPAQVEAELAYLGPGGRHADAGDAGADPRRRLAAAPLAAPRPARDRRDRAGLGERDPQRRAALAVRPLDVARRRGDRAARERDPQRARARPRAAAGRALRTRPSTASTTGSASRARTAARRSRGSTSRSTRSTTAPTCQTGGRVLADRRMSRLLR